jgi:dihydroorotate dehydrogenase
LYRLIFKLFFTKVDPEFAHHLGAFALRALLAIGLIRPNKSSESVKVMGLQFQNRLGMAAGFDKNAKLIRPLYALGFGHVEIGTVTALPQPGNPKPRLFRLVKDRALINRMGFNNDGVAAIATRLAKLRSTNKPLPIIGVNIGKSKVTPIEDAVSDYSRSTSLLAKYADYLAVNVSSPNTPGLRDLQQVESLRPILQAVKSQSLGKPVLVKIAPDLSDEDVRAVADLAIELELEGVIATNTTISRDGVSENKHLHETGGLSGPVLNSRSVEVLKILRGKLDNRFTVISVGGVETKQEFQHRLSLGADLVQAYTAFIYHGPAWPRKLTKA